MSGQWHIQKFGGSSLADATCFQRVASLLLDNDHAKIGVVVSAMGGMTDALLRLVTLAEQGDADYQDELDNIGERYASTARSLIDGDGLVQILDGNTEFDILVDGEKQTLSLRGGSLLVVPQGCWHRFRSQSGVTVLTATPQNDEEHTFVDDWQDLPA